MKTLIFVLLGFLGLCEAKIMSEFDFDTTVQKIKAFLLTQQIPIFAEINHSKNAKDAGLSLPESKVILFGNPKVGTLLMQENINISFDLPLKIVIIQQGYDVIVESTDIKHLSKTYNIKNKEVIQKIETLIETIITRATKNNLS